MKKFAIAMATAALLTLGAGVSMAAEPSATYMDSLIRAEAQHHRRGPMHPGPVVHRMTPAAAEKQAEAPKQDFRTQPAAPQEMTPPQGDHHRMGPPPQGDHHRMGPPPAEGHHRMGPPPQDGRQLPPPPPEGFRGPEGQPPEGFRGPEGQPPEGFRPPHDGRHFEKKDGCPCYEAGKHHKDKKEKHHKEHREGRHERADKK